MILADKYPAIIELSDDSVEWEMQLCGYASIEEYRGLPLLSGEVGTFNGGINFIIADDSE